MHHQHNNICLCLISVQFEISHSILCVVKTAPNMDLLCIMHNVYPCNCLSADDDCLIHYQAFPDIAIIRHIAIFMDKTILAIIENCIRQDENVC